MNIQDEIKSTNKTCIELQEHVEFLQKHEELLATYPRRIAFSGKATRFIINNLSQLHEARDFMRKLYGSWEDTLDNVFYCSCAIATWRDPNHPWSIWLECKLEDFPKELLPSDSCHWVETTSVDYNVQCVVVG